MQSDLIIINDFCDRCHVDPSFITELEEDARPRSLIPRPGRIAVCLERLDRTVLADIGGRCLLPHCLVVFPHPQRLRTAWVGVQVQL